MKPINHHYIPEWMLWKFRVPLLYQLDIITKQIEIRHPSKAASEPGRWAGDIEDGFSIHDDAAAQIYRKAIWKKAGQPERIDFTPDHRRKMADFISQFYIRNPNASNGIQEMLETEAATHGWSIKQVYSNQDHVISIIRASNPQGYWNDVRRLGREICDRQLIAGVVAKLLNGEFRMPNPKYVYDYYLRNNRATYFASLISEYYWMWLKTEHTFVIADNPLVRWCPKTRRFNMGILKPGVEMTIPFNPKLCLKMVQKPVDSPEEPRLIDEAETIAMNIRQRSAATQFIYSNSPEELERIKEIEWHPLKGVGPFI